MLKLLSQTRQLGLPILLVMAVSLSVMSASGWADSELDSRKIRRHIVLEGILGGRVILAIDGQRKVLASGQSTDTGIAVLKINPESVLVKVDGESRILKLGGSDVQVSPFKARELARVTISRDAMGMYATVGSINGLPVSFLVDTGATTVAMNAIQARRLGIDFRVKGNPTMVNTAAGVAQAYHVRLDKVAVGEIQLQQVDAVVLEGAYPQKVLLGMSFLGQLEMNRAAGRLHLEQKF